MTLPLLHVDAFADAPFAGNPAAVCVLDGPREDAWLQKVAREMNLSETAFLLARPDGFRLRWFTPMVEVDLCGHATLASAHVLWEEDYLPAVEPARFHTRSGLLTAQRTLRGIELDFPSLPAKPCPSVPGLVEALGVEPVAVYDVGKSWLVEIAEPGTLRNLKPDPSALGHVSRGRVIVTSRSDVAGYDFISRFFAPGVGVDEDPVTGSAHCALAPFWAARLGRRDLVGFQASARGGVVGVQVVGDRVRLSGKAVTVVRGELLEQP